MNSGRMLAIHSQATCAGGFPEAGGRRQQASGQGNIRAFSSEVGTGSGEDGHSMGWYGNGPHGPRHALGPQPPPARIISLISGSWSGIGMS